MMLVFMCQRYTDCNLICDGHAHNYGACDQNFGEHVCKSGGRDLEVGDPIVVGTL